MKRFKEFKGKNKNPFLKDLEKSFVRIRKNMMSNKVPLVDEDGKVHLDEQGRIQMLQTFVGTKTILKDARTYLKIYASTVEELLEMSSSALRLFFHIVKLLKPNRDFVFIERGYVMKECKWGSNSTFYSAVVELIERGYIYPCDYPTVKYWLNPDKIYNGDRRKLIPKEGSNG